MCSLRLLQGIIIDMKILLFGATGHAGRAIARELSARGHDVTAVVRNETIGRQKLPDLKHFVQADVTRPDTLRGICEGFEAVVSALGKSVSPNDWSAETFSEVDLQGNLNILAAARLAEVKQFVYLSAFGAERMQHLRYFQVHHAFSEALKNSGLNYAIIQPPAIMSSFLDLQKMAKKGWLMTIGAGNARTNPISEQDLAKVCADALGQSGVVIAAGGKNVYTRHQINEIIQQMTAPERRVRRAPMWMLRAALPFWKLLNRNMYDKLAFFAEVIQDDVLAPQIGETSLEAYFSPAS
jgi:uncharacterized protein YbjT (DUF2867 family)